MTFSDDFFEWVDAHASDDTLKLRLKYSSAKDGFDYDKAITQIECRQRFGKKLAKTLSLSPEFYFPSKLAGEQSSSDLMAEFHASLVIAGEPMIDMTSGLGIDVFHCASKCLTVLALDRSPELVDALRYNANQLKLSNVSAECMDCRKYLSENSTLKFGTIFIDPARRDATGGRVYSLQDCEPDLTSMLDVLLQRCKRLVIKMSPMLDISHTIAALNGCSKIISIGNNTECKELIAVKDSDVEAIDTEIYGISLSNNGQCVFSYTIDEERNALSPLYREPVTGEYFYEPYPSLMKLDANKLLASKFGLVAIHPNCRLYHSVKLVDSFPGNIYRVVDVLTYNSKNIKRFRKVYPIINVASRNFGLKASELKCKLGVKDGGDKKVIGINCINDNRILVVLTPIKI